MNKKKNDLFPITPKIFDPDEDSRAFVSQNSTPKESADPYVHQIQNKTSSFIVDWQLPGMGMADIKESYT